MNTEPQHRHAFARRLHDEIGCAEGCSCLTPAIQLASDCCDRIVELEAALKPFAAIGAQIRWLDGSGYTTARLRVDDIVAAQKTLKR